MSVDAVHALRHRQYAARLHLGDAAEDRSRPVPRRVPLVAGAVALPATLVPFLHGWLTLAPDAAPTPDLALLVQYNHAKSVHLTRFVDRNDALLGSPKSCTFRKL